MKRIRVVQFCTPFGLSGSAKTCEIFSRRLNRDRFEVFAAGMPFIPPASAYRKARLLALLGLTRYRHKIQGWDAGNALVPIMRQAVGDDHFIQERSWYLMKARLLELKPDILHVHYSGNAEPPTSDEEVMSTVPITVTTNIFEKENTAPSHRHVARMLFLSHDLLKGKSPWAHGDPRAQVLYYPIEKPKSDQSLRKELGLAPDIFVIGRVGRPSSAIHHPISLRAYQKIETDKTCFLALAPSLKLIEEAQALKLRHFITLPPTTDETYLSKFYNTIDILAHARRDGETFGCNIAEAMVHGRPVVSHRAPMANAQEEVIGATGYVTDYDDDVTYAEHLRQLRDDPPLRATLGELARKRVEENFDAAVITRKLENIYEELLSR